MPGPHGLPSNAIIAREETQVRAERVGLKVTEVALDAGDSRHREAGTGTMEVPQGGWCSPGRSDPYQETCYFLAASINSILFFSRVFTSELSETPCAKARLER